MKRFFTSLTIMIYLAAALSCKPKSTYPDISQASYTLITGQKIKMQELKGKPVIVTFWATTCVSCIKEIPDLIELHNRYGKQGLMIIAVAMPYDRPDHVLEFVHERKLPYSVALDIDANIVRGFGNIQVTPNNFLIGSDGKIHHQQVGILNKQATKNWLNTILNSRS